MTTAAAECRLVIVQDEYTTKLGKLVAVSLLSMKRTALCDDALAQYRRSYEPSLTAFVNALALAVSHHCNRVQVVVAMTYYDARTLAEAEAASKSFSKPVYSVSITGKVVRILPTDQPRSWQLRS